MTVGQPRITAFLIKVASRCNIACDYCYVYTHADQSWRHQPAILSPELRRLAAARIAGYSLDQNLERVAVIFHGGEPLLAGAEVIAETVAWIRDAARPTKVDAGLQTNGLLLDEAELSTLRDADIAVSLSLDGPPPANDLHRVDHAGRSTFQRTEAALQLLEKHRETYSGIITVIDPAISPRALFEFFAPRKPPRLDFLLPDANYDRPPLERDARPTIYRDWLIAAFDLWFDEFSELPVRIFDSVLAAIAGADSGTDAFGLGDVSLLTIETDGTYHDLDVLKITREGQSWLGYNLRDHAIADALQAHQLQQHRRLLTLDGLSATCRSCPEVAVCGGGSVPHRYRAGSFDNPTIYCAEMLALIRHARARLNEELQRDTRTTPRVATMTDAALRAWEAPETSAPVLDDLANEWRASAVIDFERAVRQAASMSPDLDNTAAVVLTLPDQVRGRLATLPSTVSWSAVMVGAAEGRAVRAIDGTALPADPDYLGDITSRAATLVDATRIHARDKWLRLPFGDKIIFEPDNVVADGAATIRAAFDLIVNWRPSLLAELHRISPDLQFISDPTAHPDKAVSFSDNSVPGALYATLRLRGTFVDPHDLADAIIHEHRHQKLYLLQRHVQFFSHDWPLVASPWRDDPRPPSGLLHAVFVFVHLIGFWRHAEQHGPSIIRDRAHAEVEVNVDRLHRAFDILADTALTEDGKQLVSLLHEVFDRSQAADDVHELQGR